MADIINLNRFRKAKARVAEERRAEENRVSFGRTKAEKLAAKAETERARRAHEAGRLEMEGADREPPPNKDGAS